MKKTLSVAMVAVCAAMIIGCSHPESQNGLKTMNLKGAVKSLRSMAYEPVEGDGGIIKGEPLDYAQSDYYYEFNTDGLVARNEWYADGALAAWDEYSYDKNNRIEKIVSHSIYYDGDATAEVEWTGARSYVRRTYGDNRKLILEETVKTAKNRIIRTVKGGDGKVTSVYTTYFKKGRLDRVENKSEDSVVSMEYEYNDNGDESFLTTYMDGELFGKLGFDYLEYDDNGNWTVRVIYEVYEDDSRVPVEFTERAIEYYK